MFTSKPATYLLSIYLQIILPLDLIDRILTRRYDTIVEYILLITYAVSLFYFIYSFSYWEYTNYYLRYVYCLFIIAGVLLIIYRIVSTDSIVFGKLSDLEGQLGTVIWTIALIIVDISIILSKIKKKNCFDLAFPFKNGQYLVVDGGDGKISYFSNYHYYGWKNTNVNNYYIMQYAVDIIKMNKYGFANKMLQASNEDYNIFGEKVYSPVDGEVGNSGKSTRPHLHIHVVYCEYSEYQFGEGTPIKFNNSYPVKNCVIKA